MTVVATDLWSMIPGGRQIDPAALSAGIERQVAAGDLDFRTRLLIRDAVNALAGYWGPERVERWIQSSPGGNRIREIRGEPLGKPGFPSLAWRVMEPTRSETIFEFLEELGGRMRAPATVYIGGSAALILPRLLTRATDDIDVVDELPAPLREEHQLLDELAKRYGLRLAHFQSRYLPTGWQSRAGSLGRFGDLEAHVIDPYDVCLSKLFSNRGKDLDDLRHLKHQLDKAKLVRHLLEAGGTLRGEDKPRAAAELNWRVLYGEPLPLE
jgi:hypothetical protein